MADLLSAVSVLLVFLTFLLTSIEKEITEKCNTRKPELAQKEKRKLFNNDLIKLLFLKIVPIILIYFITFYALLPKSLKIITNSSFELWNFDELNTIFIFIELGLLSLTIYAVTKLFQLIKKITE
jgi:hypothetical protein